MSEETEALEAPDPNRALESGEEYLAQVRRWRTLIKSGYLPKHVNTPEKAIVLAMRGAELGWAPMQSINSMHLINGKVEISSEAMHGLIRSKYPEFQLRTIEHTEEVCRVGVKMNAASPENVVEFTMADAKRAGLTSKDVWRKFPKDMLWARCISRVRRYHAPDTGAGVFAEGEIPRAAEVRVSQIPDADPEDRETVEGEEIE